MSNTEYAAMLGLPPAEMRNHIRSGAYGGQTAGFASGKLQANVVVLGDGFAEDFLEFCAKNHQPCPLVGVSARGDPRLKMLGDIDITTDVPSYNVYRNGVLDSAVETIAELWSEDMVAFALGCSFTFERALLAAGVRLKHIEQNRTVPMYRTNIALSPVGKFVGEMVVSMRPIARADVDRVCEISAGFSHAHGAPVHVGDGAKIGIDKVDVPDWGDKADFSPDDIAVYWACGVTPQNVITSARPPICLTHTPGCMLVTDAPEDRMPDFERRII